jgi:hypothetical protein
LSENKESVHRKVSTLCQISRTGNRVSVRDDVLSGVIQLMLLFWYVGMSSIELRTDQYEDADELM